MATNAFVKEEEKKGVRVEWVTTQGFEDLIEIGRQTRQEIYALEPPKIPPLVPRFLRFGVENGFLPMVVFKHVSPEGT